MRHFTYLHETDAQCEADAEVVAMRKFDRENRVRHKQEDTEWQYSDTDPTRNARFLEQLWKS
jgi:hypothetical protein